ncbi:MAG: N-acetylmuramoyl-L-alanine amidase [Cytophagaceae bacterium]
MEGETGLYSSYSLEAEKNSTYKLNFPRAFSSVSFNIKQGSFSDSYLIVASDTFRIYPDLHHSATDIIASELVVINGSARDFRLYTGNMTGNIQIHFNHVPPAEGQDQQSRKKKEDARTEEICSEPQIVTPAVWRTGLPAPVAPPDPTKVKHIIIHHSAGSNSVTNYTQQVRDIYVFHTKPISSGGRGYNDIAYNFLIAPDGVIYQGRDDQGLYDKDNIKGAHLCARNDNTMGVCLLGTFTVEKPTAEAYHSLFHLISWKLNKEKLLPADAFLHPVINPDRMLSAVAGHRQGCGTADTSYTNKSYTECPGDSVIFKMPYIKASVKQNQNECSATGVNDNNLKTAAYSIYPQPAKESFSVSNTDETLEIFVYNSASEIILKAFCRGEEAVDISMLNPGLYFVEIIGKKGKYVNKLLKN